MQNKILSHLTNTGFLQPSCHSDTLKMWSKFFYGQIGQNLNKA